MKFLPELKLVAAIALLLAAGLIAFLGLDDAAPSPTPAASIDVPAIASAGETITVDIVTEAQDRATIEVHVASVYGLVTLEAPVVDGRSAVELPPAITATSGSVSVAVAARDGALSRDIRILPSEPAHIRLLVTGETLRNQSAADVTAFVTDSMSNPVADDTTVQLQVTNQAGSSETVRAQTVNGIATFSVPVDAGARRVTVVATSSSAVSSAHELQRLGGEPVAIALRRERSDAVLVADGQTFTPITSDTIVDSAGALLPNGTVVTLVLDGPDGAGMATGRIEGDVLRASVVAPQRPGTLSITPVYGSFSGATLQLEYGTAVLPFKASFESPGSDDQAPVLTIGPVLGWHGGLVPDGTIVTVDGTPYALSNGIAALSISTSNPVIEVLGQQGTLR